MTGFDVFWLISAGMIMAYFLIDKWIDVKYKDDK